MLVTPAETSRSQTACADPAGVAITPIATLCLATRASSSSTCLTVSLAILLPTIAGSESSMAEIVKPRETKPP